jgi:hypothetical protein
MNDGFFIGFVPKIKTSLRMAPNSGSRAVLSYQPLDSGSLQSTHPVSQTPACISEFALIL